MEKKFFDYRKDGEISIVFSEGKDHISEMITSVIEEEEKTEYNMELDSISVAA